MDKIYDIVVWGNGRIKNLYLHTAQHTNVVLSVDNNPTIQNKIIEGVLIYPPKCIKEVEYDYVVLFIEDWNSVRQVKKQLINEIGVAEEKIIHWTEYVYATSSGDNVVYMPMLRKLSYVLNRYTEQSILDIDMALYGMGILSRHAAYFELDDAIKVYGIYNKKIPLLYQKSVYTYIYADKEESFRNNYSVGLFLNPYVLYSLQEFRDILQMYSSVAEKYIICIEKKKCNQYDEWMHNLGTLENVIVEETEKYVIVIVLNEVKNKMDTQIYVVTHKKFVPVVDDMSYVTIHAGKKDKNELGYRGDDVGDNISDLNPYLNECTALYWMWKNIACENIGLNHYRRYFLSDEVFGERDVLSTYQVRRILSEYDIILPRVAMLECYTLDEHMRSTMDPKVYEEAMATIRKWMRVKVPDYLDALDYVWEHQNFFICQMFITKKHIMDQYCEWLFSFLLDAANEMKFEAYDVRSKRAMAYIAERLFTVWLCKQDLKIKELPVLRKDTSYE